MSGPTGPIGPTGVYPTYTANSTVVEFTAGLSANIAHGIGSTPTTIIVCDGDTQAGGTWEYGVYSSDATNFRVQTTAAAGIKRVNWLAFK